MANLVYASSGVAVRAKLGSPIPAKGKVAVIIGAGPAGLTAAWELLERTDICPVVLEASEEMGGLSRTVEYKGNRIDIGGHRFFSKSDRVMDWWLSVLPLQAEVGSEHRITYHRQNRTVRSVAGGPDPQACNRVMLIRERKSRIYYLRKFFDYPLSLGRRTVLNLGFVRMAWIVLSYLKSCVAPIRPERNLEEFFINRFGNVLYRTFFKSYTEKVWGLPCEQISAEWGAQRIKGLSIRTVLAHALKRLVPFRTGVRQKDCETSLIERFLYPKFGPGQMWQEVANKIRARGGQIVTGAEVCQIFVDGSHASAVEVRLRDTGERQVYEGDYLFSSMPIKHLVAGIDPTVPPAIREVSDGLVYRDFVTVGLLVRKLKIKDPDGKVGQLVRDNWIYIQEPDVKLGRLQIFNNWSPHLVANPETVWLGLEYFCNEADPLWALSDQALLTLGAEELTKIDIIDRQDVLDGTVLRVPKAYPAYFGAYDRFAELRAYLDRIDNLFLIGRNGMHRYNNQDHSMLAAMVAVDNIVAGRIDKDNIWSVNTEQSYHETADRPTAAPAATT
ncbi:MAG: NAD(P)/FAD-dependent oxidoreductase [Gemmataceae bacterium]